MANRRQVIQCAAAAVALSPLAAPPASAAPSQVQPQVFLADVRFPEGVDFAARVRGQGRVVHLHDGDLTAVWRDDLEQRWNAAPIAIAGLTTPETLHVLELLAAGRRARVIHRTNPDASSPLVSWVIAPVGRA